MRYRIGIDVGGTFTDVCVYDGAATVLDTYKEPTNRDDPGAAVSAALQAVAAHRDLTLGELLGDCELVVYGTTVGTNAIITGDVGKVGLLCTAGLRDILSIREGGKEDAFDYSVPFPAPYVPRRLTLPIRERVSSEGDVVAPLEAEDVERAVEVFKREGVDAIAVAFLWSFMHPEHELEARELVAKQWPSVHCVLSHEANPVVREYRRTIATAIDASLYPVLAPHLESIERSLQRAGLGGQLLVVSSLGGAMTVGEMITRPLYTIGSGPTMAPVAAQSVAARLEGARKLLVCDMGGTSFDISIVDDGRVAVSREAKVGPDLLGVARIDVHSVGAGGGSIARIDEGGVLHVGPASAGAIPGPACYGRGGTEPTVTDADLLLGYLEPEGLAGGRLPLDREAASAALSTVAGRLGEDQTLTAFAIYGTVNQLMVNGIEAVTVREGVDPADTMLVGGGGACGVHVAPIAQELGIATVLVPAHAGTLSAFGATVSDITHEFSTARFERSSRLELGSLNRLLGELKDKAEQFLAGTGRPSETWEFDGLCEARYAGQIWELVIELPALEFQADTLARLLAEFHSTHERTFGFAEPEQEIEFLQWRVRGTARTEPARIAEADSQTGEEAVREAYFGEERGWLAAAVLSPARVRELGKVEGPAIVQEVNTTVVVPPEWQLNVVPSVGYLLRRELGEARPLAELASGAQIG
jgi:N-methylhydantoinase A